MANANFYALTGLLKSDWDSEKTTIGASNKGKFTVTQMELIPRGRTIPRDLTGKGADIAIIDGIAKSNKIDTFHSDHCTFKYRQNILAQSFYNDIKDLDQTFHATKCAGIAVGAPFDGYYTKDNANQPIYYEGGVAPEANAKIFLIDTNDEGTFLRALEKIQQEKKYDVISISLGYPEGDAHELIKKKLIELSASTLIVVSAGNYGPVKGVVPPANLEQVISVGSLEKFGHRAMASPTSADIDCYGEVCAPATDDFHGLIQWATGTSMAAPAIAGLICLIMQCAKNEEKYLSSDDKEYVLHQIKEKQNMLRLLKKTVSSTDQVKPAVLLNEAYHAKNFKAWFDSKMN